MRVKKTGTGSVKPSTLNEEFEIVVGLYPDRPALSEKINGEWRTLNFAEYFEECVTFGRSLMELKLNLSSVNIIGFNAPQWHISFYGSLFARCIPIGIYTTNSTATCHYIAEQSECQLVVAENFELAKKYLPLLENGTIKAIVIYRESKLENSFGGRVMLWKDFMGLGKRVERSALIERLHSAKPGHCCTLVYTSGTTGMPKGVMLSHDNYTFLKNSLELKLNREREGDPYVMVSYLPLSHAAAQFQDIVVSMMDTSHMYFADPDALQGSLIRTLQEVRPTIFFSVPRVWEKIYEKMQEIAKSNGWLKTKISTWAKSVGLKETLLKRQGEQTSLEYKMADTLIFTNVKKALGLDRARYYIFGAAALSPDLRMYFMSLGMFLMNGYGMSECAGPQTITDPLVFRAEKEFMKEAGTAMSGTEIKIFKENPSDTEGEICYRGRNIFMGYLKNEEETLKTIDEEGYLHSGDVGWLNNDGVLFITGRLKELLKTAAGENIPPLLIENEIREALPWISNVMLVGDGRKFLTCLITLKVDQNGQLAKETLDQLRKVGSKATSLQEASKCPLLFKSISNGLQKANEKAISRAQRVQGFAILPEDFSVENGLFTPTLKLKRKEVVKRYKDIIEQLYLTPGL